MQPSVPWQRSFCGGVSVNAAINAAWWVVSKAPAPVGDTVLEDWATSKDLGFNVKDLKMELLYVQAILTDIRGKEIQNDNPALGVLLQMLRDRAYNADDVLDELDYFRIQDDLYGTSEAADEHPKGCIHNLAFHARNTVTAAGKQLLCCLPACSSAGARRRARDTATSSLPHANQADGGEAKGCMRKLASEACNTIRDVGKRLPCSSLPCVRDDVDGNSGMLIPHGAINNTLQRKDEEEAPKLRLNRVTLSKRMKFIVEQLRSMRHNVSDIIKTLGPSWSIAPSIAQSRPLTTSESIEPKLYARDLLMKNIIHDHDITQGRHCGNNLTVLPIVGPGGVGKTTLAQHIYHNPKVQSHFHVKVWVCVSLTFNVNKLTEDIKNYIPKEEDEKVGTAGELIAQRLKSKRLLLVLDDMWTCRNEDEWKRLLLPFKVSQVKGTIIMVTTRLPALAQMIMVEPADHWIDLEGLAYDEFKELFLTLVFGDEKAREDYTFLLETGEKIMGKLKGSPLAAKTVGRLLRNHPDLDYWIRVLESKEWELQENENDIMPALKLSFDYLPFHLQQCFSYCALFPQDYMFGREELVYFWIGLDILQSDDRNKKADEEIGLRNLNDLVSHGFFKKEVTNGHTYYSIHDLLHDLAMKVASHECLSVDRSNARTLESGPSIRHLSIHMAKANDDDEMTQDDFRRELSKLKTKMKVQNLRTLLIFGVLDGSFFETFSYLFLQANAIRVLETPMISFLVNSALVHLRYLDLNTLPNSEGHALRIISRFYHLRIFYLKKWGGCLPLPRYLSNLTKLRHFLTNDYEFYCNIFNVGKLQKLQELKRFRVKETDGFELKQLGNLMELRELGIYNLEKIHTKEEAMEARLVDKNHLQNLTLSWCETQLEPIEEALVLEGLQPHKNLHVLNIEGNRGIAYPTWLDNTVIASFKTLHSLYLCGIFWEVLPCLGLLPMLKELELSYMPMLTELVLHSGDKKVQSSHNLKRLKNFDLKRLEKCFGLFNLLEDLVVYDCPRLLEWPFNNISYQSRKHQEEMKHWLPNLQEVEVCRCQNLRSLPSIPWTPTLNYVKMKYLGSTSSSRLRYSRSSFGVALKIYRWSDLLIIDNLTDLQDLKMESCPPMESKHLKRLKSLRNFLMKFSSFGFPSESEGEVQWTIPVENLSIIHISINGKQLAQLLPHLPNLSELNLCGCEKITRIGVAKALYPSSLAVTIEDTKVNEEDIEDGLLLLPIHLADSLQSLKLSSFPKLSPVGGGLQALSSLSELYFESCPKFFSAYQTSSCCPFPSSLQKLKLVQLNGMGNLKPLSNLTSLKELEITYCREHLRSDGLWHLVTQGQLTRLKAECCPNFFASSDIILQGLWDEQEQLLLQRSSKLQDLETADVVGFLVPSICSLLTLSLTKLTINGHFSMVCFTKEQEEALQLLTSLQDLTLSGFSKLQCFPAGLSSLINLKRLCVMHAEAISSLPKEGLPNSLQELDVWHCGNDEFKKQCRDFIREHPGIKLQEHPVHWFRGWDSW